MSAVVLTLIANQLSWETLKNADVATVDTLAKAYVKKNQKLKETKGDFKDATKAFGKVACALEIRLNHGKDQKVLPANKSLAEFIKDVTGEKVPTHALTLKNAFGSYVLTGLISEDDYDSNSNNCLEIAARVVDAVKGNLAHDAVTKAAAELKARTDKEAQNLRDVLASVKPAERMTAEEALENLEQIAAHGHLVPAIAHLLDVIVAQQVEREQREAYLALASTLERVDSALNEKVETWLASRNQPIQVTAAGIPVGTVNPETGAVVAS